MILGLLLLLAASPERLILLDETVQVPARQWRAFDIELRQRPAIIECRYAVEDGAAGVRVALMHHADLDRFRDGVRHRVLAATEFQRAGTFRYGPGPAGDYSLVVDNRIDGRGPTRVRLVVSLTFLGPYPHALELSWQRRLVVILLTAAFMTAVVLFAARRLKTALRKPGPPTVTLILLAIAFALPATAADDWIALFNGKDLTGWQVAAKPEDRDKDFWKVQDGVIICDSLGHKDHDHVWLINDQEYGDFELKLKVRGFRESPGNSGVQIRSRYDHQSSTLGGPQIDVNPPAAWRTGLIYDETRGTTRWIFPSLPDWKIDASHAPPNWKWDADGWNTIEILCRGTNIVSTVNGIRIADFNGDGILNDDAHRKYNVGLRGHIALQLHIRDELRIQYKDIYVRPIQ